MSPILTFKVENNSYPDLYMVITMKKTGLFLLVLLLMIGVCGCGMKSSEAEKVVALNHVENKYGGSFEVVSYTAKNIDLPYDEVLMQDQAGSKFFVYIKEDENGKMVVQDGYYGILKADEYHQILRDILDKHFTDYKLFSHFTASYFDNEYDGNYDLRDALKMNKAQFFSRNYIFVDEDDLSAVSEAAYEELSQEFEAHGLSLYIVVYSTSKEELETIDETEDVNLFLPDDYRVNPIFKNTIK